jgi:hypothetical protein
MVPAQDPVGRREPGTADAVSKAVTTTIAQVMRTLPFDEGYLGNGFSTGESFFGVNA